MSSIENRFSVGKTIAAARVFRISVLLLTLVCISVACLATEVWGAIPTAERTTLMNLYTSTNGANWTNNTNWNGDIGTECTWYGVFCDGDHVFQISLDNNNLTGTLPDLSNLINLQFFNVSYNQLSGSIPSLGSLFNLAYFYAVGNQLTGSIPSLSGLTNLHGFLADSNQLTGSIPSLSGLTNLIAFQVRGNQLTGSIPSLSGLSNLQIFYAGDNQLTGVLPPFSGLTSLEFFDAYNNQMAGSIPSLSDLTNLRFFWVSGNQLIGSIPSLSGLSNLWYFGVNVNQLTGSIPSLGGLSNLSYFYVDDNQLTGSIPSLNGLSNLSYFYVDDNQLTGSIPSLNGLANLESIRVNDNLLTGDVPAVPEPNNLVDVGSQLCPNYLNHTGDPAWDAATGSTPWYLGCTAPPPTYRVVYDGNGDTGGSVPVDGNSYFAGQRVTVLGNTGALYKTGDSFDNWDTTADGSGLAYMGGNTFLMGSDDMVLYARWVTASGYPVRILETAQDYTDIPSAYHNAFHEETIGVQEGLGSQTPLLFDNPHNYDPFYVTLRGGYNATGAPFLYDTGASLIIGGIVIEKGSLEIDKIIIQ
jgi:Leucine-rich repeat (LRR) protein